MTEQSDQLVDELRSAFDRQAATLSPVDIRPAVHRRFRVRRRQRLAVVAVVGAAAVMGAGLVAHQRADAPATQASARTTRIDPTQLQIGSAPKIPYVLDHTWHDGDRTLALRSHDRDFIEVNGHVVAFQWYVEGAFGYSVDGGAIHRVPSPGFDTQPISGPDGSVQWLISTSRTIALYRIWPGTARPPASFPVTGWNIRSLRSDPPTIVPIAVSSTDVYASIANADGTALAKFPLRSPSRVMRLGVYDEMGAANLKAGQFVTGDMVTNQSKGTRLLHCSSVRALVTLLPLWRTCTWTPSVYSTGGTRLLAVPNNGEQRGGMTRDPFGSNEVAVLDADTGRMVRTFALDRRTTSGLQYFAQATFEGESSVIFEIFRGRTGWLVRCRIDDGACEIAGKAGSPRTRTGPNTDAAGSTSSDVLYTFAMN